MFFATRSHNAGVWARLGMFCDPPWRLMFLFLRLVCRQLEPPWRQVSCNHTYEAVTTLEKASQALYDKFVAELQSSNPADIDLDALKTNIDELLKPIMGSTGELSQVRKASGSLKGLASKHRARLEKDGLNEKAKLACLDKEVPMGEGGTSNAEYAVHVLLAKEGAATSVHVVGSAARWMEGGVVAFTGLAEMCTGIVENKGFGVFAKWFKGAAAASSSPVAAASTSSGSPWKACGKVAGPLTFTASVSHPTSQREVGALACKATELQTKVMAGKMFMNKKHQDPSNTPPQRMNMREESERPE